MGYLFLIIQLIVQFEIKIILKQYPTMVHVYNILILEFLIIGILFFIVRLRRASKKSLCRQIRFENLELLKNSNHEKLISVIQARYKQPVESVSIESINHNESYAILCVNFSRDTTRDSSKKISVIATVSALN